MLTLVEYLYLDDVQEQAITHSLYQAALYCGLQRLVTRCEAHYAHQLDLQLLSWPGGLPAWSGRQHNHAHHRQEVNTYMISQ
jgi:HPt (histidine-containing phosphotransfer) domain-containing protein